MVSPSDGFLAKKVEVLVSSSAVSELELKGFVASFIERNRNLVSITTGWAPDPPKEHTASKLAKVTLLSPADFSTHQIYWLWRDNGEEKWNLVDPWHWSVVAAKSARWAMMELPLDRSEAMLESLPIEALKNY